MQPFAVDRSFIVGRSTVLDDDLEFPSRRVLIAALAFALSACGGLGTTLDRHDRHDEWRIGACSRQFCVYHRTTTAGASPPAVEDLIWPLLPVLIIHGMRSNLAAYWLVAVPTWPLFALIGWPALKPFCRVWRRRFADAWDDIRNACHRSGRNERWGFEVVPTSHLRGSTEARHDDD